MASSFPTNTPLRVSAPHDGLYTTTYHLTIAGPVGYQADLPVAALANGVIGFSVPGLSQAGNYAVTIAAVGPGGTTTTSPFAFDLTSASKPNAFGPISVVQA